MKKFIILVVAIIILILVGYSRWGTPKPIILALVASDDSDKPGEAILSEVDGQVKVELKLVDATGDPQSVSINRGSCTALGEEIYVVNAVTSGSSVTTITASFLALETHLPLALSGNNFCGDLVLK